MNDPLVSICCLGYNHAKFVEAAIESVFQQTYPNLEMIIVDDGSIDRTFEIADKLREKSPFPMQVITQKNTGRPGTNLNRALAQARGKYVRFLSLDDLFTPESTEEFTRIMEQDPELQFACSDRTPFIDDQGQQNGQFCKTRFLGKTTGEVSVDDLLELEDSHGHTFYIQNAIFRTTAIDAVGGFDEELIGDDITLRIRLFQYMRQSGKTKFAIINHPAFIYRLHPHNLHKNQERQIEILVGVCNKYFGGKPGKALIEWHQHSVKQKIEELHRLLNKEFIRPNDTERSVILNSIITSLQSTVWLEYLRLPQDTPVRMGLDQVDRTVNLSLSELYRALDQESVHRNDASRRSELDVVMSLMKSMILNDYLRSSHEQIVPLDKETITRVTEMKVASLFRTLEQMLVHENDRDKRKELDLAIRSLRISLLHDYLGLPEKPRDWNDWFSMIRVAVRKFLRKNGVLESIRWFLGRNPDGSRAQLGLK